jgi:broad specificity phosphatase PhoE
VRVRVRVLKDDVRAHFLSPFHHRPLSFSLSPITSHEDLKQRFRDLWLTLRNLPAADVDKIILVGHSNFYKDMVKLHLDPALCEREPDWTNECKKNKLDNASALCLDLEWEAGVDPMTPPLIRKCEFVFGGQWKKHKDRRKSKSADKEADPGVASPDDVRAAEGADTGIV